MAGWGDDEQLAELRSLVYEQGWRPVRIEIVDGVDRVTVVNGDEERTLSSDHVQFHHVAEGLKEEFDL